MIAQRLRTLPFVVTVAAYVSCAAVSRAQDTGHALQLADRGPRFLTVPVDGSPAVDARDAQVLHLRVTLKVDRVPLGDVLDAMSRQTGVRFAFSDEMTAARNLVSLHADNVSLAGALFELLLDTDLDVQVAQNKSVSLVPRRSALPIQRRAPPSGVVVGRVLDFQTHVPLKDAIVGVAGTNRSVITGFDGRYRLAGLAPGDYTLTARALGYKPLTRSVTIVEDRELVIDCLLTASPLLLDQVVTTVTGPEQQRASGNAIATIRADSLVATTPVTTLSEILTARVPGLQVFSAEGLSGASPQINIRGQNSLSLSNQPLLIVDGARVSNSTATALPGGGPFGTANGRFDDISLQDIESIQVVRGPSAATLYGTDAANGVIVLQTKRGAGGAPRWSFYTEQGLVTTSRTQFPWNYTGWGHTLDASHAVVPCALQDVAAAACAQDSVTHFSPLRNLATTPIGTGNRAAYGGQVSGGTDTRYYFSGSYQGEIGYLKLPETDRALALAERGAIGISSEEQHPDGYTKYGARSSVATSLGSTADVTVSGGYLSNQSHLPSGYALTYGLVGPGYRDQNDGYAFDARPLFSFLKRNDENTNHFTGSGQGNWRPARWLSGRATLGIDYAAESYNLLERNEPFFGGGQRTNAKIDNTVYSVDLGATASLPVSSVVQTHTSVGTQYTRTLTLGTTAQAINLAPGSQTVAGGAQTAAEATTETIVAGAYAQEQVSIDDRLFVTVAVRADGAGTFGAGFHPAVYPKASVSWLVSQEPFWRSLHALSSLRVRAAFGESGVQPPPTATLAAVALQPSYVDGVTSPGGLISQTAYHLNPERQREFEGGLDLGILNDRFHAEATYYDKRSSDALIETQYPVSASGGNRLLNIGAVRNWGYEGLVSAELMAGHTINWTVALNGSVNHNTLVRLGPGNVPSEVQGIPGYKQGLPLFSFFDFPYRYSDSNHNGIIEPSEVTLGPTEQFIGTSYPKVQATATTRWALLSGRLTLAATFDYRGGFKLDDVAAFDRCLLSHCIAAVAPTMSLANQAAAVAGTYYNDYLGSYSDASFTRFRELSLTWSQIPGVGRALHARTASITLSARNLALWTHYRGTDPEVQAFNAPGSAGGAYSDTGSFPPGRYWLMRLDLGF